MEMHDYDINTVSREIYIFPRNSHMEIDAETAVRFIKNIRYLDYSNNCDITIHMYCNGGSIDDGFAMYDNIKACKSKTTIIAHNGALSMGGVLLQAANERIMLKNSLFMAHFGSLSLEDTATQKVKTIFSRLRRQNELILSIYADRAKNSPKFANFSLKKINSYFLRQIKNKQDLYLTAEQAVEHGLCDRIL